MIAVIDYQMGNLRSVQKAFERVGYDAEVTDDPALISRASKIVLPGVGAFADAIAALKSRNLVDPIRNAVASGRPFLGICLGLQLLFERSLEDGDHEGMGLLPGIVRRFDVPRDYKVPHMGWNQVCYRRKPPIFEGIEDRTHFYFVHSFYAAPSNEAVVAGEAEYPDPFCAMVWQDNLFATQFHPEKSQDAGLRVLRNFAQL